MWRELCDWWYRLWHRQPTPPSDFHQLPVPKATQLSSSSGCPHCGNKDASQRELLAKLSHVAIYSCARCGRLWKRETQ